MLEIQDLTHVIAALNGVTVICLCAGYIFIRRSDKRRHRASMITAVALAALFLVVYAIYKANAGFAKFGGEGLVRPIYFGILLVHVLGAMAIVVMVPMTLYRALKGRFKDHRRLARWTWPLWMYVGVSGVVVYVMAVHFYPYVPV